VWCPLPPCPLATLPPCTLHLATVHLGATGPLADLHHRCRVRVKMYLMADAEVGAANLAAFVAATAGRRGESAFVRGGRVTASPIVVANAYINSAVPLDDQLSPTDFLDDTMQFFAERKRSFVVWVPDSLPGLATEALARGGQQISPRRVAMVATDKVGERVTGPGLFDMRTVNNDEDDRMFAYVAEQAFKFHGLGTLLLVHDCFHAPATRWVIAYDGEQPVGVACGFIDGEVGGLYFAGTIDTHRGRGVAADLTANVTDYLFGLGADRIVLQSLDSGVPAYQRLGFTMCGTYELLTWESR
jgi:GNAT superfamily N-acetyltransferase